MNILMQPPVLQTGFPQRLVLYGVKWAGYEKILEGIGDSHVRITYDRGALELMSPLPIHEVYKCLFLRLFDAMGIELGIAFRALGSTTFRREDLERGLEPDQCFYFASRTRVHNWRTLDLSVDPPPDLAIEVDVTNSCLDRMGIYAALGVPELWRLDGETLQVYYRNEEGVYEPRPHSPTFPFLELAEFLSFVRQIPDVEDDMGLLRLMHSWVRDRVRPRWEAHIAQQSSSADKT